MGMRAPKYACEVLHRAPLRALCWFWFYPPLLCDVEHGASNTMGCCGDRSLPASGSCSQHRHQALLHVSSGQQFCLAKSGWQSPERAPEEGISVTYCVDMSSFSCLKVQRWNPEESSPSRAMGCCGAVPQPAVTLKHHAVFLQRPKLITAPNH